MRNYEEVSKGLVGLVNLWDTMANEDISGEFRRRNKRVTFYWRLVRGALELPIPNRNTLQFGFWLESRFAPQLRTNS